MKSILKKRVWKKNKTDSYQDKKKYFIITDIIIIALVLLDFIFKIIRPDHLVIGAYFLTIPYLMISHRKKALKYLVLASLISLTWMIIAKDHYGYNNDFINIFGINTFPLFSWALGLFFIYMLYSYIETFFIQKGFSNKMILFCILFFPSLILIETIWYHMFNIHNIATNHYSGLPICNCIHAPVFMQLSYFIIGPIFFILCYIFKEKIEKDSY